MRRVLPGLLLLAGTLAQAGEPAVSAGRYHNLALTADGSVLWWGRDEGAHYRLGQNPPPVLPRKVEDLPPAIAVAAGWEHSSAITVDGSVYEWGFTPVKVMQVMLTQPLLGPCVVGALLSGGHGPDPCKGPERARAARMQVVKPMRVALLPPAVAIAANDGVSAIISRDGNVHCWAAYAVPHRISGLANIKAIALGQFHGLALRADGVVLGWGGASGGGIAYQAPQNASLCLNPQPQAIFTGAIAVAADADASYALRADGTVWVWGSGWHESALPTEDNSTGKLDRFAARRIATLEGAVQLGGGTFPTARTAQGVLTGWQRNPARDAAQPFTLPRVGGIAAVSSYSAILGLRTDGFICTMGENMGGATLPNSKEYRIAAFTPVPRADGKGPLNLIDPDTPVPPDLCVETKHAPLPAVNSL